MKIAPPVWILVSLIWLIGWTTEALASPSTFSVASDDYRGLRERLTSQDKRPLTQLEQFQSAVAAWRLGDFVTAKSELSLLIEAKYALGDSYYLEGLIHLSEVGTVNIFKKTGTAKKALNAWQQAVEADPAHALSHFAIVGFFTQAPGIAGGDIDKAKQWLPKLQAASPYFYQIGLGLISAKAGEAEAAEAQLTAGALTETDQPVAMMQLAQFYFQQEAFDQALAVLSRLRDLPRAWHHPTLGQILLMQGLATEALGDRSAAEQFFQQAAAVTQSPGLSKRIERAIEAL